MLVSPKTLTLPLLSPSYSATFPFGRPEEVLKDKDRERDKDREKRALLSDAELNAIRRNATQVLELHETLFSMLLDAVRASGWVPGLNALEGSELGSEAPLADTDTDNEQRFESALRSVASLFTAQVSKNFFLFYQKFCVCVHLFRGIFEWSAHAHILWKAATFNEYEAFCAEHSVAIEIVKNLQRKRPGEWDTFKRRCIELVSASLEHPDGLQERDGAAEEDVASLKDRCPDVDTKAQDE